MKILYLDDSYRQGERVLGYGGYHVDSAAMRRIGDEVAALKDRYGIPRAVELKWAPPRDHFLRTRFGGVRHELYRDALAILERNAARVMCAVHFLNDCYGVSLHSWPMQQAIPWAAKQQLKFLADGFQLQMLVGTEYETLDRIGCLPLVTSSKRSPQVQLADIVAGVTVAALAGSRYGVELFEAVARSFLYNPHEGATVFASMLSAAVLGFGLKLFPIGAHARVPALFADLDRRYIVTQAGIHLRDVAA